MAKRGRKPKNPGVLRSIDPEVAREGFGLLIAALAVVLILAEFGAAGRLGATLFNQLKMLFGVVAYIFAFWIAYAASYLLKPDLFRRSRIIFWGSLIFLVLLSALIAKFGAAGGAIGGTLFYGIAGLIGEIAAFIIILIVSLVTIILTFNISISELAQNIKLARAADVDVVILLFRRRARAGPSAAF